MASEQQLELPLSAGVRKTRAQRLAHRPALVPHSDNATSRAAADQVKREGKAKTREAQVLDTITEAPCTDEELELRLRWDGNSVRPRRRSLERQGLVHWTGETRPTRSGRQAKVWAVSKA